MNPYRIVTLNLSPRNLLTFRGDFHYRVKAIEQFISWHQPDLIMMQNLKEWMLPYFSFLTDTYTFYGRANKTKERNCILFKKEKFLFTQGTTIPFKQTDKVNTTLLHLETKDTHQSLVLCNTNFQHVLPFKRKNLCLELEETLSSFPKNTNILLAGDYSLLQMMQTDLAKQSLQAIEEKKSQWQQAYQQTSKLYRPKDTLILSSKLILEENYYDNSLYMGSFPSTTIPVFAQFSIPLKIS